MQRLQAIQRNSQAAQAGLNGSIQPCLRELSSAGLDGAVNSSVMYYADDFSEVFAEVGFATYQGDLAGAQACERLNHFQALRRA